MLYLSAADKATVTLGGTSLQVSPLLSLLDKIWCVQQMTMHTSKSMVEAQTHRSRMSFWLVTHFARLQVSQ